MSSYSLFEIEFAEKLINKLLSSEQKEQFKITSGAGIALTPAQQFVTYFNNHYLKYSEEVTIFKAIMIFDYAQNSLEKLKLAKAKLAEILKPENFYQTFIKGMNNDSTSASINIDEGENTIDKKQLNIERADTVNVTDARLSTRSATSQFNEEDIQLEDAWRKEERKDEDPESAKKNLLDLNVSASTDLKTLNLESIVVNSDVVKLAKPEESETLKKFQPKDIAYTGAGVGKNKSKTLVEGGNTAKGFTGLYDKQTNNSSAIQTSIGKVSGFSVAKQYIYSDALFKTLNMEIQNFRNNFFEDFRCLFQENWTGYQGG